MDMPRERRFDPAMPPRERRFGPAVPPREGRFDPAVPREETFHRQAVPPDAGEDEDRERERERGREEEDACPFCNIAAFYAPWPAGHPPPPDAPILRPSKLSPHAYVVLSTPGLVAFLDIMPLARGHVLLCPRAHRPRLTDTTPGEAADLGLHLRLLGRALVRATGVPDWNVVQNNGAAAAQVVGHVHYHLIPRPGLRSLPPRRRSFTMFGRGVREELDDDEAVELAARLRGCLAAVLEEDSRKGKL